MKLKYLLISVISLQVIMIIAIAVVYYYLKKEINDSIAYSNYGNNYCTRDDLKDIYSDLDKIKNNLYTIDSDLYNLQRTTDSVDRKLTFR